MIKAIITGNIPVQQNCINWSYRNRGKVALNQTNKKQNKQVFKPSTMLCKLMKVLLIKISVII